MPSALEHRVVSAVLRSGSLSPAIGAGLKQEHFKNREARRIYKFIEDHWYHPTTRNELPMIETLRERFPGFALTDEDDRMQLKTLITTLRAKCLGTDLRSLAEFIYEVAEDDAEEALRIIKARLYDIDFKFEPSKGFGIREVAEGTRLAYEGALDGTIQGVPWPWECLTEDTMGKKGGDLIVFYGRMKSMKTWALLKCACEDFMKYKQRVLIWSKEMSEDKMKLRLGSILAKVDYQLLKSGKLPEKVAKRAFNELSELSDMLDRTDEEILQNTVDAVRDLIVVCGPKAPKDVSSLSAMVRDYKPDVLYIDSFYHLQTPRAGEKSQYWYKITCLAEELKELAMEHNIPVIITAQANRMGEKNMGKSLDEVANSDAIAREADLIMRIIKRRGKPLHEKDYEVEFERQKRSKVTRRNLIMPGKVTIEDDERPPRVGAELAIVLGGNREGVLEAFTIHAVPGYNFNVINASFDTDGLSSWAGKDQEEMQKTSRRRQEPSYTKDQFNR